MQVSTKLFNEQSVARFSDISGDIQNIQARIATGKNILKASDDPVAAVNISAAKEQKSLLERFEGNIDRGLIRLSSSEVAIKEMQNVMTRIYELSIQARNDTYNQLDRRAIKAEVVQLRELMVDLANTKDSNGASLFSGFKTQVNPFIADQDGRITYQGDQGSHSLPVSETMRLATGVNGVEAFMRVKTNDGYVSLFGIVDDLVEEMEFVGASDASLDGIKASIDHIGVNIAKVGALMNTAEAQKNSIAQRKIVVSENLSTLEDADLSKLVTELQSLIVSRDAAQQTFVQISRQNLFDFLR